MESNSLMDYEEKKEIIESGAIAGIIAGGLMALISMVGSYFLEQGFWFPIKLIGTLFFGVKGVIGGAEVVVIGLLVHIIMSAAFGIFFASFTSRFTNFAMAVL